ncbi:MAG: helix-turn-helix transcriptional regulator [Pseudomonadota bacterium]
MTNEIDHHVGKRLRRRRRLLGLTQQQLAQAVGIRFQQVQKYECGANRVSASRLFELAEALDVPVQYFYEGLQGRGESAAPEGEDLAPDILSQKETVDLVRAYYKLNERPRRRLLELAKSLDPVAKGKSEDAA